MKNLLLLVLLFFTPLFAEDVENTINDSSPEAAPKAKVLYLNYEKVPQRVLKGEVFPITLKVVSTLGSSNEIEYKFSNYQGLKLLNTTPQRVQQSKYYFDTFYFLTTSTQTRLPDITASVAGSNRYAETTLSSVPVNVIALNPKKDFSNIIADSFELVDYRTTSYDNRHNIIVFVATATNSDLGAMKFENVFKQGIESLQSSYVDSRITYFVVINKEIENFSFSYFNLKSNNFSLVNIPIVVDDDSVTTQSDLKPTDQSREILKMQVAGVVAFLLFLFVLWRKKYIYLILVLFPLAYIVYLLVPSKIICINQGAKIHLLPVNNGTIFETAKSEYHLKKEGRVGNFIKVELPNEQIGWVQNEDICSR